MAIIRTLTLSEFDPKILTSAESASSRNKERAVEMLLPVLNQTIRLDVDGLLEN